MSLLKWAQFKSPDVPTRFSLGLGAMLPHWGPDARTRFLGCGPDNGRAKIRFQANDVALAAGKSADGLQHEGCATKASAAFADMVVLGVRSEDLASTYPPTEFCVGKQMLMTPDLESFGVRKIRKAADDGFPEAMYLFGRFVLHGVRVVKNKALAYEYFERGAALKHAKCVFFKGLCLWDGMGVKQDEKAAWGCFQEAVSEGLVEGKVALDLIRIWNEGKDKPEELPRFEPCSLSAENQWSSLADYASTAADYVLLALQDSFTSNLVMSRGFDKFLGRDVERLVVVDGDGSV